MIDEQPTGRAIGLLMVGLLSLLSAGYFGGIGGSLHPRPLLLFSLVGLVSLLLGWWEARWKLQ